MNRDIIKKMAVQIIASLSEQEVEKLLLPVLKGTEFANKTYAVGGYVRDQYLGKDAKDLDIVVEMDGGAKKLTNHLKDLFGDSVSTPRQMGAGYPIWQITFKDDITHDKIKYKTQGAVIEFADTMKENFPDEESRQRETEYGTLKDDIERRDFTVNMLLKDLTTGEVKDLTGVSKSDLNKGILRGHPKVSLDKIFSNDPLRMIRLVRFQAKYGWEIPKSVLRTVMRNAERIEIVSAERIMEELKKLMVLGKLDVGIKLMKITGLLKYVLPEIDELRGVMQSSDYHGEGDVFNHTMLVLKGAQPTVEDQLAALLHDVGKKEVQTFLGDKIHFYGHEDVGAQIAKAILKRLKFDNKTIDDVSKRIKFHMKPLLLSEAKEKGLKKFIRTVGDDMVDAILALAEADVKGRIPQRGVDIEELKNKIEQIRKSPIKMKEKPILDGNEIMKIFKLKQSPKIREIKDYLLKVEDDYASDEKVLTKDDAIKAIKTKFKLN